MEPASKRRDILKATGQKLKTQNWEAQNWETEGQKPKTNPKNDRKTTLELALLIKKLGSPVMSILCESEHAHFCIQSKHGHKQQHHKKQAIIQQFWVPSEGGHAQRRRLQDPLEFLRSPLGISMISMVFRCNQASLSRVSPRLNSSSKIMALDFGLHNCA